MEVKQALLIKWIDGLFKKTVKYHQTVIVAGLGVVVLGTAFLGYGYYKNKMRASAYKDFMSAIAYYDGVVKNKKMSSNSTSIKQFESESDKWQQTEQIFKQGYENYKNTELAPAFLAFRAEALLNLGKVDDAIKVLKDVINQVKSEEIKDTYKLKVALINMDKKDEKAQVEGFNELIKLADNDSSFASEAALYQAGSYFWNQKKYNEAKNYWQRLLVKTMSKSGQSSVYAAEVREKLALITAESL
jgi:tetratricopeptide (TPR) repeat protein